MKLLFIQVRGLINIVVKEKLLINDMWIGGEFNDK